MCYIYLKSWFIISMYMQNHIIGWSRRHLFTLKMHIFCELWIYEESTLVFFECPFLNAVSENRLLDIFDKESFLQILSNPCEWVERLLKLGEKLRYNNWLCVFVWVVVLKNKFCNPCLWKFKMLISLLVLLLIININDLVGECFKFELVNSWDMLSLVKTLLWKTDSLSCLKLSSKSWSWSLSNSSWSFKYLFSSLIVSDVSLLFAYFFCIKLVEFVFGFGFLYSIS